MNLLLFSLYLIVSGSHCISSLRILWHFILNEFIIGSRWTLDRFPINQPNNVPNTRILKEPYLIKDPGIQSAFQESRAQNKSLRSAIRGAVWRQLQSLNIYNLQCNILDRTEGFEILILGMPTRVLYLILGRRGMAATQNSSASLGLPFNIRPRSWWP
jgi:hypothetical protein